MEKIARTCIKNTKRLRKKLTEASEHNISTSDIEVIDYYKSSLKGVLFPDTPEPMDFEIFLQTFKTKESLISHCSEIYADPYNAIKHLYTLSKQALISVRNRLVYNK